MTLKIKRLDITIARLTPFQRFLVIAKALRRA